MTLATTTTATATATATARGVCAARRRTTTARWTTTTALARVVVKARSRSFLGGAGSRRRGAAAAVTRATGVNAATTRAMAMPSVVRATVAAATTAGLVSTRRRRTTTTRGARTKANAGEATEEERDVEEEEEEEVEALLREILDEANVVAEWIALDDDEDVEISGIANDINALLSGDLYVCAATGNAGAAAAREAVAAGAVAVVAPEPIEGLADVPIAVVKDIDEALADIARVFYGDPSKALTAIALTGSVGKTTTSYLVKAIFEEAEIKIGLVGSNGNLIDEDLKLTAQGGVWESDEEDTTRNRACTAPGFLAPYRGKYEFEELGSDALQFQQLTAGIADNGAQAAVMEVSAEQVRRKATRGMNFDIVALTSMGGARKNYNGLDSEYSMHVAEVFKSLSDAETQRAVLNVDEQDADLCREYAQDVPIVTYSTIIDNQGADVYPARIDFSLFETAISLSTPAGNVEVVVGLVGEHMVGPICCAVAVGLAAEIPLDVIAAGLEAVEVVPGRMELIDEGQDFSVLIDSADTPEAIEQAILSARATNCNRVITLIGCEGDDDGENAAETRAVIGRVVHNMSDVVFITNGSPKGENPYKILEDVCSGFRDEIYESDKIREEALFPFLKDMYEVHENAQYECMRLQNLVRRYIMVDRYHAIRAAIGLAEEGDVVLILGRGAKDYFVVGREKHWFEDALEARDALQKIGAIQSSGVDTHNLPWASVASRQTNPGAGNLLG